MTKVDSMANGAVTDSPGKPVGVLAALEKTAWLQLSNRVIWLIAFLTLLNIAMVSLLQLNYERFDTMQLMALIGLFLEFGLFSSVLVMFLTTRSVKQQWQAALVNRPFSYPLNGLAICLNAVLLLIVLMVPVLYVHRYPELAAIGLRIPLMMLQREILVLFAVLISVNMMQISRYVLKFPWLLSGVMGVAAQMAISYSITVMSQTKETFIRLNDVFYYNQLSSRFDWFPDLRTEHVFYNMEFAHFFYYLAVAGAIWLVSLLLWLPAALKPPARG